MNNDRCHACDVSFFVEDEKYTCAQCEVRFHASCLSEEGEDGMLCSHCGKLCPNCNMVILYTGSAHICNDED